MLIMALGLGQEEQRHIEANAGMVEELVESHHDKKEEEAVRPDRKEKNRGGQDYTPQSASIGCWYRASSQIGALCL